MEQSLPARKIHTLRSGLTRISDELARENELELVLNAINSYKIAKSEQKSIISHLYSPTEGYAGIIGEISKIDLDVVKTVLDPSVNHLRNVFRGDSDRGLWDKGDFLFESFSNMGALDLGLKSKIMNAHCLSCRETFPSLDPSKLQAPHVETSEDSNFRVT